MAVEALTAFPASIVAGDTLRATLSDGDYPSSDWTLEISFRGPVLRTFPADSVSGNAYEMVIPASDTAKLKPGTYVVTFIYTDDDGERTSVQYGNVQVVPNPSQPGEKTIARKTLEAMEAALEKLAAGTNLSVSFNGQSFSKKNLNELQDAIDRQRAIVAAEEGSSDLATGRKRFSGIGIRFANDSGYYNRSCDW